VPGLAEIQSRFRDAVVVGSGIEKIAPWLTGACDPQKRLTVHRRNYQTSLVDALLVKFPATGWLIGTPLLTEAARHFIQEHPPEAACIAEYGAAFPDFLAQFPRAEHLLYLREFAQLEWSIGQVSIAIATPPIDNDEFSKIDAQALPDALLILQPGLRYRHVSWPVDELIKLYLTETVPDQFDLSPAELFMEVYGARGNFHLSRLDAVEFIFRKSVSEGLSLGDAAERALDVNATFDPGGALSSLIAAGLITEIKQPPRGENS